MKTPTEGRVRSPAEGRVKPAADDRLEDYTPARPLLVALAIFILAALTLCWPMFQGKFLAGQHSDQFMAGYSFRHFAAEYFKAHGHIPLWNPYLFGGLPFVGAAHGDIFYPTALLRLILPTDTAMNLGFLVHIIIAGWTMYGLMRTLGTSWGGAVVGGIAYELSGIVISMVYPGHDGKLFVSAVAPLMFSGIVWAVRDRKVLGYAVLAMTTGLAFQGHPQTAYYLMVAAAIWGGFWAFGPEGPTGRDKWVVVAGAAGAVALGIGLYAIYLLPMMEHAPFSPRVAQGPNYGYEYATSYSLPANELLGVLLPYLYGFRSPEYFGGNPIRLHSEYLGAIVVILAALGFGSGGRRTARRAMVAIGILFLLVSLGGSTPFFRLWYAIMPMTKQLRAPGQAFIVVAMTVTYFAGIGAERLLRGEVTTKRIFAAVGVVGGLALLGSIGVLQAFAEAIGRSSDAWRVAHGYRPAGLYEKAIGNASALRLDSIRLLIVSAASGGIVWAIAKRHLVGTTAIAALLAVAWGDLWIIGRKSFEFSPPASVTYGDDDISRHIRGATAPFADLQAGQGSGSNGVIQNRVADVGRLERVIDAVYPGAWLMGVGILSPTGYHGNELMRYREVFDPGGQGRYENINALSAVHLDLAAVRYIVISDTMPIPRFHKVLGPVETKLFGPAYLYEADSVPRYVRILSGAVKVPDSELAKIVGNPQLSQLNKVAIYPVSAPITPDSVPTLPPPSTLAPRVTEWSPGHIKLAIAGSSAKPEYLIVSENWFPTWKATVDGKEAALLRAQNTFLSVVVPPGAKEVTFDFTSPAYQKGKLISSLSLLGLLGVFAWGLVDRRKRKDA